MKKTMKKTKTETKKVDSKIHYRTFEIDQSSVRELNEDTREVDVIFSSEETEVDRWFGKEKLGHDATEVRLERLNNGAAVLVGHSYNDQIGVVEKAEIDSADRTGRATLRFGRSARAQEIFDDVKDGIRRFVSVGYRSYKQVIEVIEGEIETHRVIDWEPLEISIVPVPADVNAEILRADNDENYQTEIEVRTMETDAEKKARLAEEQNQRDLLNKSEPVVHVDVNQVRNDELTRIREISAIGDDFNLEDAATSFIDNGRTVADFNQEVVKVMKERGFKSVETPSGRDADIGLTQNEGRKFSIANVVRALANKDNKRIQEMAAFEMECSRAVADALGKDPQGFFIPNDALRAEFNVEERDMNVGTGTAGGNLVATELLSGSFIEALRNALALVNAGTMVLDGLQGNIAIPKKTGTSTAYWVTEGNAPTESEMTIGQAAMSPKTVGGYTDFTRKLLLQSSLAIEPLIRQDLITTLALEIDRAGINGSGTGAEPEGILNTTGIGSVVGGTNGLAPTWAHMVGLESEVANDNAAFGSLAYLTNTKVRGKLKTTEKFSGGGKEIWEAGDMPLNGNNAIVSNQVPSDLDKGTSVGVCSAAIYGNFADLVLGLWGSLDITVDPYTASTTGTTRIVALQDVDYGVRNAESFAAMLDILTA